MATVYIDGRPSSALDLSDPTHLSFGYMQIMDAAARVAYTPAGERSAALHLGGCGCALPRAWARRWPDTRQVAVEIDPDMVAAVRAWFDLPKKPALSLRCEDARDTIVAAPARRYRLVVRDVFAAGVCPIDLADAQAWAHYARIVTEDGLVMVNSTGGVGAARAQADRAREAGLEWVRLVGTRRALTPGKAGNVVVLAAHRPLDDAALHRALQRCDDPAQLRPHPSG
nr:fused MFS/spermidine synthase [Nanchangia anserum]